MNDIVKGVIAYKALDHCITSADARLASRTSLEHLDYLKARDARMLESSSAQSERSMAHQARENMADRSFQQNMMYEQKEMAREAQDHELRMQGRELRLREAEMESRERMVQQQLASSEYIARLQADTEVYNADRDREARLMMHAKELDQTEQLELRKLRVKENIARQSQDLQIYLAERGINSRQEIERFKALAQRETQILMARENANNMLQDSMVQEAIKTFPLDISPIVLLRSRSHSLTGLLRFSTHLTAESGLPSVAQVYNDVSSYSTNPEPLNIFIAPIHIDSKIQNREKLSQQLWDSIYQYIEKFFTENYDRRGNHPVILYPTSWKDKSSGGQHASETLHFFLKDLPSMVIEPRFDGHSFSLMLSMWNVGYTSNDHIRTEMNSGVNLDAMLINAAYIRSKKSLKLIDELGDKASALLEDEKHKLSQNVEYYESLHLEERIATNSMDEISAVGVYKLFNIDPVQDMVEVAKLLSDILCVNLAVISDIHHLQATDAVPVFPNIFKTDFPTLYEDKQFRNTIFMCYKRTLIFLRNGDSGAVDPQFKRDMERVREMQIINLEKQLELLSEEALTNSLEDKLIKYASEMLGITGQSGAELWSAVIDKMAVNDIPFFREILPNIDDRQLYKRIDKKISDLKRNSQ